MCTFTIVHIWIHSCCRVFSNMLFLSLIHAACFIFFLFIISLVSALCRSFCLYSLLMFWPSSNKVSWLLVFQHSLGFKMFHSQLCFGIQEECVSLTEGSTPFAESSCNPCNITTRKNYYGFQIKIACAAFFSSSDDLDLIFSLEFSLFKTVYIKTH